MIKTEEFFSDNSLHLSILHSWIAIPYMPTTAAKRPHAITTQKHNKIPMNLRCSLTMAFSLWFSYRASCLEPSSSSHCPWKCRRICDKLAFIDTISWITRFALPENFGSIQYLKSQGFSTFAHCKNLLPASTPDHPQAKIGYCPWRQVIPVRTTIPSLCSSSNLSSC